MEYMEKLFFIHKGVLSNFQQICGGSKTFRNQEILFYLVFYTLNLLFPCGKKDPVKIKISTPANMCVLKCWTPCMVDNHYCSAWPRFKLNTKIGLHTTTNTTHHPPQKLLCSNSSAVTELGISTKDSSCHCDICLGNICPGYICPYQQYLSGYWPDMDQTSNKGSWEHIQQIRAVTTTFVQATFVLGTFVHISNISAVTGPIWTKF